jgi:23S rRNA (guanosine2251-2'-O)-methyltransferase
LGYTPSPLTHPKVQKTSLWAENLINIIEFIDLEQWYQYIKNCWYKLICMEVDPKSINITQSQFKWQCIALVMGNEIDWVEKATLERADEITLIPLVGTKESLNVSQAAAIGMWEFVR